MRLATDLPASAVYNDPASCLVVYNQCRISGLLVPLYQIAPPPSSQFFCTCVCLSVLSTFPHHPESGSIPKLCTAKHAGYSQSFGFFFFSFSLKLWVMSLPKQLNQPLPFLLYLQPGTLWGEGKLHILGIVPHGHFPNEPCQMQNPPL